VDSKQASQFTAGLLIVTVGVVLLFSQMGSGWGWNFGRLWPLVFIALAAGQVANRERENWGNAVWFLFLGGIFLMHTFRVLSLGHSWPLFIVFGGLALIFGKEGRRRRDRVQS
jgi:LiaF transmembrane domain